MLNENIKQEKTVAQLEAEEYQSRLDEIRSALAEEVEVLKPLELSLLELKGNNQEFDNASHALRRLVEWLSDNPDFENIGLGLYQNMKVKITERSGQSAEAGVPEFFIPVLVFPDADWRGQTGQFKGIGGILTQKDNVTAAAVFCPPEGFEKSDDESVKNINPLSVTGLILSMESGYGSNAVHEGMHFLDVYRPLREGADEILSEIIAFRQAGIVRHESFGEMDWDEFLSHTLDGYFQNYGIEDYAERKKFEVRSKNIFNIINNLDRILNNSSAVTHILLNCLTLKDIEQWEEIPDDDIRKMFAKNYE